MKKPKSINVREAQGGRVSRPDRDRVRLARNRFGDITSLEKRALRSGDGELLTDEEKLLITGKD